MVGESLRVLKELLKKGESKTEDAITGEHFLKCANLLEFEIYNVKKSRGAYKITCGKHFKDFQDNIWLSFWNEDYQREEYIFDNFFVIENSDYALSQIQFNELQKENRIIYGGWYDANDKAKCYAIVRDADNYNYLKSQRLAFWKGKALYEVVKRKNFDTLKELSDFVKENQGQFLVQTYKKNEVK